MQPLSQELAEKPIDHSGVHAVAMETSLSKAKALDRNMRTRLADSLEYVAEACAGKVPFDGDRLQKAIAEIRTRAVPARTFAAYGDLVLALNSNDLARAEALFADIADILSVPNDFGVFRFRPPDECAISNRYLRWMDTDPEQDLCVLPLTDDEAVAFDALLNKAWHILDKGVPELAAQTRFLAKEIIVARGNRDPKAIVFDGASSFLLWGAILINADTHKSAFELAQALVHESGHNLLFGYCTGGSLVANADAEHYPSPLRVEERPMDGVVHATYVTARMHLAVCALLRSETLSAPERVEAEKSLEAHERAFESGLAVIERDGKLTELGRAVMAGAKAYMRQAKRRT